MITALLERSIARLCGNRLSVCYQTVTVVRQLYHTVRQTLADELHVVYTGGGEHWRSELSSEALIRPIANPLQELAAQAEKWRIINRLTTPDMQMGIQPVRVNGEYMFDDKSILHEMEKHVSDHW